LGDGGFAWTNVHCGAAMWFVGGQVSERIERAVEVVNAACQKSALEAAVATGRFLLDEFYGGSYSAYRRQRTGRSPLRTLAEHPDLAVSASFLSRAIGVAHQMDELPQPVAARLSLEQHRALLGLPADAKRFLANRAIAEGWSARRLAKDAASLRKAFSSHPRPGRPRLPAALKTLRTLERLVGDEGAWRGLDSLRKLPQEERSRIRNAVGRLQSILLDADAALE
jgi:hypothetical protein